MSTVLVLGAGTYQVPLIERARDRGLRVVAASYRDTDPGLTIADEAWLVDTTDHDALLSLAREHGIDAVATTGTDVAVPTLGRLCDELGLPGISHEVALKTSNKVLMQQAFQKHDVPAAQSLVAESVQDAARHARALGYPVVVKAPDSSGSRGVIVVRSASDIDDAAATAFAVSKGGQILVEEYLEGVELGAQAVMRGGELDGCYLHNDTVTGTDVQVPVGHSCPVDPSFDADAAAQACAAAAHALGIGHAVCNVDLMATDRGLRVLEIGARPGATCIPEVVELHFGIDLYDVTLDLALGEPPALAEERGPGSAALILGADRDGTLRRFSIPERLLDRSDVVRIVADRRVGDQVHAFHTGPDRIGEVVVTAADAPSAEAVAREVAGQVVIEVAEPTGT